MPRRLSLFVSAALLAAVTVVAGPTSPASALDLPVTTTADGGAGSLRDAIDQVNGVAGPHTITLGTDQTYQLTRCPTLSVDEDDNVEGDLDLFETDVTIIGNGSVIEQTCASERVMHLVGDALVDLVDVEITGGDTDGVGGGILVSDAALDTPTSLYLEGSTVWGNTAGGSGGGIYTGGDETSSSIFNSTFTGNTSENAGGGMFVAFPSVATVRFSTFASNTGPTGSNFNGGSGTLFATLMADPIGDFNCSAGLTSGGYNFADDDSCPFGLPTDVDGTGGAAQLGALADNGGPTRTLLPADTSPIVDLIPEVDCTATAPDDQRDVARPGGDACEPGAVEIAVDPEPDPDPEPEDDTESESGAAVPVAAQPRFTG